MNNVITAGRMSCMMRCPRQHFWQYEVGLRRDTISLAFKIGSAWARAMEARWQGKLYEEALAVAIPEGISMSAYDCNTVAALLAGYYDYYGPTETVGEVYPEVELPLRNLFYLGETQYTTSGVLDCLGSMKDGRSMIIEGKTTSDSIDEGSDYWLRLRFNMQVCQYIIEAREHGWDPQVVYYDVTRKPSIRPKEVYDLDSQGRKIVLDLNGNRVFLKRQNKVKVNGGQAFEGGEKQPKQSADSSKGETIKKHVETPEEFSDRLWRDTQERPAFYFMRKEFPVIEDELESFGRQRLAIVNAIHACRIGERMVCQHDLERVRDAEAWPRNVSEHACNFCTYKNFCLQNTTVDFRNPPEGFSFQQLNPELNKHDTSTDTEQSNADTA